MNTRFLNSVLIMVSVCWGPMVAIGALLGPDARVASSSLVIKPLPNGKKIEVSFRLVDAPNITVAAATAGTQQVPVAWTSYESTHPLGCAWMIVLDNSNPARQRTVETCVKELRKLLEVLPVGDAVMLASLSQDLAVAAPFEATADQRAEALGKIRAAGLSTLIYQNVKQALLEHLAGRKESRRCIVLITDGKDETPPGADAVKGRRDELIAEAKKLGVVVHTIGVAERPTEANYFADLKEVSLQTEGLHVAAVDIDKVPPVPKDTWLLLKDVMHGGGTAVLDVAGMESAGPVHLELRTAARRNAVLNISTEVVAQALGQKHNPVHDGEGGKENLLLQATHRVSLLPSWAWWAVASVALAVTLWMINRARRRAAEEEKHAAALREEQARALHEMLAQPKPSAVLAYLEMCDAAQSRHPLTMESVKIGRGKHNDIVLPNDSVSGSHCVLSQRNGEWMIADLGSGNGVLVNGQMVKQSQLKPNDIIELGDIKMRFFNKS